MVVTGAHGALGEDTERYYSKHTSNPIPRWGNNYNS